MKATPHILLSVLLLVSAGCANMSKRTKCVIASAAAGAVVGGGAGVAIGNQGDTDNRAEGSAIGAAAGAVIGGGLGLIFCKAEELDSDGDGVLDSVDACPNTPIGVEVDERGCPLDSDGDGVPDYQDKCPNTPRGTKVDEKGCPIVGEKLLILRGINFEFDSATIKEDSETILDEAVNTLKENPSIKTRIEGHTDGTGTEEYNLGLSQRRADAVRAYLISQGIAGERLSTVGKGEAYPVVSNDTREGRSKNRRIEFVVVGK